MVKSKHDGYASRSVLRSVTEIKWTDTRGVMGVNVKAVIWRVTRCGMKHHPAYLVLLTILKRILHCISIPFLLFSTGKTIMVVFYFEFLVAQLPDKIKGLGIGLMLVFSGTMTCIIGIYCNIHLNSRYAMMCQHWLVLLYCIWYSWFFQTATHYMRETERSTYRP